MYSLELGRMVSFPGGTAGGTIAGYMAIVPTQYQFQANSSGFVSSTVWANDQITCNGTLGASQYYLSYIVNGTVSGTPQCYQVVSTQGLWNLNTQTPITCGSSPPNTLTVPKLGRSRPARMRSSVDLPAPFSPMST